PAGGVRSDRRGGRAQSGGRRCGVRLRQPRGHPADVRVAVGRGWAATDRRTARGALSAPHRGPRAAPAGASDHRRCVGIGCPDRPDRVVLGVRHGRGRAAARRDLFRSARCPAYPAGSSGGAAVTGRLPARVRLRRRLLIYSAPVAVGVLLTAIKLISVVIAGHSAAAHFAAGDADGLRRDVATLHLADVIEPQKARFAAGTLAVLDGRLADADARFTEVLSGTAAPHSCPVRINLELVRERQGDHAAWAGRPDAARERYRSALRIVDEAPPACFAGNTDPDPERRAVRADAA